MSQCRSSTLCCPMWRLHPHLPCRVPWAAKGPVCVQRVCKATVHSSGASGAGERAEDAAHLMPCQWCSLLMCMQPPCNITAVSSLLAYCPARSAGLQQSVTCCNMQTSFPLPVSFQMGSGQSYKQGCTCVQSGVALSAAAATTIVAACTGTLV